MSEKLICDNRFSFGNQTIALPVSLASLPPKIIFQGRPFLLKDNLHVSLVCLGKIIEKHNITIPGFEDKVIADFCAFSLANDIGPVHYTDDFRFAVRDERQSIIVMCAVQNLNRFFDLMNEKYSLKIEYPPTHVTLYTPTSELGIFLVDSGDIAKLTSPIENPIGRRL